MARTQIDKQLLDNDYEKYVSLRDTNRRKAELYIYKSSTTRKVINMAMHNFKLRQEYHSEARYWVMNDYFRALETYRPDSGASLFTWVYRLLIQSVYNFIKKETKELNRQNQTFSSETTPELANIAYDGMDPLERAVYEEDGERFASNLDYVLTNAGFGPIEKEVYYRMNGCGEYIRQSCSQIADSMRLTVLSVEQVIKRNQNLLYNFRKYIKENGYTLDNVTFDDIARFRNYEPDGRKRKKTSRQWK